MVEGLLKGLKKEDELQGPLCSKVLDQGDAVGAWFGKDQGGPLAAILFATSETLKQVSLWHYKFLSSASRSSGPATANCSSLDRKASVYQD